MTARAFADTNVWVYAVDGADPAKRAQAVAILGPASGTQVVISGQVLGEFYVTVTRKLVEPLPTMVASAMVDRMRRLPTVQIDGELVAAAVDGSQAWGISYWDALIVCAAAAGGCEVVVSEDLADGGRYGSVRVENPFADPARRLSETRERYDTTGSRSWTDAGLRDALGQYEDACRLAGMRQNAVHSYWDYARRFLDWRDGTYRPRGAHAAGRPVPLGSVTIEDLTAQASAYASVIAAAGRMDATVDTYHRHAMFFVRWLDGVFMPGRRARRT